MTWLSPRPEWSLCSEGNKPHRYFKQHQKEDRRPRAAISWIQPVQFPTGYRVIHQGVYNLVHLKLSSPPRGQLKWGQQRCQHTASAATKISQMDVSAPVEMWRSRHHWIPKTWSYHLLGRSYLALRVKRQDSKAPERESGN